MSGGNTPEPSIRNESRAFSIWDFMPKKAAVHDVEKQEHAQQEEGKLPTLKPGHGSLDSPKSVARPASSSSQPSASADNLPKAPRTCDRTSKPNLTKPSRSKHPPPSFAKYSGNPSLHRQSSAVRTFEGIEAVYRASTYLNPDALHGGSSSESYTQSSSGDSSSDSGPISSAAPRLLTQKPQARPRHHSVDFELLNSHRQSQAAETGQLTPKTRKPTSSVNLSGYPGNGIASSSSKDLGYFGLKPDAETTSTPPSPRDNPSPPKVDALPAAVRRSSIPDVTPFAQFVQTAPAMPLPVNVPFAVAELERKSGTALPKHSVPSSPMSLTTSAPPAAMKNGSTEQAAAGAVRPSFEKERRGSQVLRGHGTGFEILQPGSLPAMAPAMSPPPEKYHAVPPVSLQKYARSRSRSSSRGSTGRKLQKKKRTLSVNL